MADDKPKQRKCDDGGKGDGKRRSHCKKRRDKRADESALHGAFRALTYMPAMNPARLAKIPDEVKGTDSTPSEDDC